MGWRTTLRGVRGAIDRILPHLGEYRRQYAGIVVRGGARRILVNFFPDETGTFGVTKSPEGPTIVEAPDWKERWFDGVNDGDTSYWRIQYDVAFGRFLGFDVNPSA